jgi:hypothetical protein
MGSHAPRFKKKGPENFAGNGIMVINPLLVLVIKWLWYFNEYNIVYTVFYTRNNENIKIS